MKKRMVSVIVILTIISNLFILTNEAVAVENTSGNSNLSNSSSSSSNVIDERTESKVVEIKKKETKSLDDYKEKYGSDAYGLVAYILNIVRVYSIPFCFLGIAIGAIYQYVIGVRKLDTQEKGMGLIVSFVTILVICQVLPLVFVMVVKLSNN